MVLRFFFSLCLVYLMIYSIFVGFFLLECHGHSNSYFYFLSNLSPNSIMIILEYRYNDKI